MCRRKSQIDIWSGSKSFNNQTEITFTIFTMKLCPRTYILTWQFSANYENYWRWIQCLCQAVLEGAVWSSLSWKWWQMNGLKIKFLHFRLLHDSWAPISKQNFEGKFHLQWQRVTCSQPVKLTEDIKSTNAGSHEGNIWLLLLFGHNKVTFPQPKQSFNFSFVLC